MVISDEVYENLTYDGVPHVRIATLPGMWERTLTLCSAGKTFSVTGACLDQGVNDTAPMDADLLTMTRHYTTTGWKIGWLVGHAKLISGVMCCNQWCVRLSIAAVPVETNPTQVNRPSPTPTQINSQGAVLHRDAPAEGRGRHAGRGQAALRGFSLLLRMARRAVRAEAVRGWGCE